MVRITVDRDEAAAAVPHIRDRLRAMGVDAPLIGDFHYIGHKLLDRSSRLRRGARQIPHQSRQCRLQEQARPQFSTIVEIAIRNGKAVRIGANWGSLDQELLTTLMDENAKAPRRSTRAR
jgi:(E)-4-hydroxy-3-methylbut-2-enyl-diphosphate synthase